MGHVASTGIGERFRRVAAAVCLIGTLAAATPPMHAADLFDEIYARGEKQNGGLRTLTATFVETSTSSLLATPLISRGTVSVERPSRIGLRYTEPDIRRVVIDGGKMTTTWPSRQIETVKDIAASQRRVEKYFVNGTPDELRSHFTISAREASDRPGTYLVAMQPKRKQILEGLSRLDLWIDQKTLLMAAMRMTFPNGDSKLMIFSDVKVNVALEPGAFAVK